MNSSYVPSVAKPTFFTDVTARTRNPCLADSSSLRIQRVLNPTRRTAIQSKRKKRIVWLLHSKWKDKRSPVIAKGITCKIRTNERADLFEGRFELETQPNRTHRRVEFGTRHSHGTESTLNLFALMPVARCSSSSCPSKSQRCERLFMRNAGASGKKTSSNSLRNGVSLRSLPQLLVPVFEEFVGFFPRLALPSASVTIHIDSIS
jgi:hypothetical protein